jgi:Cys-tRNA(Pro)/Cys-tRNA(Cys) deacylase
MEKPPVSLALKELGVQHRVFHHAGPVHSLEQAAHERGQRPGQVVRTILFRLGRAEFVLVLVAGPRQISWKALRRHVGQSRLSLASAAEVLEMTGYPIGAVGPFGLAARLRVLIDPGVLTEEEVSIGSGLRGTAVILKSADLHRNFENAEVIELLEFS